MTEPNGMICQGCGKTCYPMERHTYYHCLAHIRWYPEDYAKVKVKHLYYGKKRLGAKSHE
jgi:hypothetical protein